MEGFQGVFTKRGEPELSTSDNSGVFEDVFVRRGRWRKNCPHTSEQIDDKMFHLAENAVSGLDAVEYPLPLLSDITSTDKAKASEDPSKLTCFDPAVIVKNTFVNAAVMDFDSLQDFLKERKVKSCPASRQASNATMLMSDILDMVDAGVNIDAVAKDEILNTASSLGGVPYMLSGSGYNGISNCFESGPKEFMLNTASTIMDTRCEFLQDRISEGVDETDLASSASTSAAMTEGAIDDAYLNTASTSAAMTEAVLDESELSFEDRLNTHMMNVSAVPQGISMETNVQQTPKQFFTMVQTPDGMVPGMVTLLENPSLQPQQTPLCTPRPSEPISIQPSMDPSLTMPLMPPPPVSAPVLRLADAIAPPELGSPELPSIGSLLHHRGECKPCTFFHTRGCENKEDCQFCHLCGPREKKKRLKALRAAQRETTFLALEQAKATLACWSAAEQQGFQIDTIVE